MSMNRAALSACPLVGTLCCVVGDPTAAATQQGAPVQTGWGVAGVFPNRSAGCLDIDPVPADNVVESGVQMIG